MPQAPFFTREPGDATVLWGDYVWLYASAVGGPPPALQWLFNGMPIARATDNDLPFPYAVPAQAGNYTVVASNIVGVTRSEERRVGEEGEAPLFTSQPGEATVVWGGYVMLYAAAYGGAAPVLQWLFNRMPIPGATHN